MIIAIEIGKIFLRRARLRDGIDPDKITQLAESIQQYGLLQPIIVREEAGGTYELIAGVRRLEAVKSLGWTEVVANVTSEVTNVAGAAITENLIRVQMNPLEEARAVWNLHFEQGHSIKAISSMLNHSATWVQDRLMIMDFPDYAQDAIATKKMSIGAVALIMRIADEDYRRYLIQIGKTNGCTAQAAEAWLMDWTARQALTTPGDATQGNLQLPPLPPPPKQPCLFCDEQLDPAVLFLMRICPPCYTQVKEEKENVKHQQKGK